MNRYYSLDVFRGATVALMILVNNPGSWANIFSPLEHAVWHGCTPTDLVFPFFLFAVGNALAFVMPKFEQSGTTYFLKKVFRRSLLIFTIGLLLSWSPFIRWDGDHLTGKPWSFVRIPGVLQRIALCYLFAALLVYFLKSKWATYVSLFILVLYWLVSNIAGAPADPYSLSGYFGTSIDIGLLGVNHIYKGEGVPFDPEGLASTLPAITQVIAGYLAGQYIQRKGKSFEMLAHLLIYGSIIVLAGYCWDIVFPVNKKIWSSSYVFYTTGLAILTLAILIFLIEFKAFSGGWTAFFNVFGKNPLFIFVLSGFLPRLLGLIRIQNGFSSSGTPLYISPLGWFYEHCCKPIFADQRIGSLLYAIVMILFYWVIVYFMHKKKIYIKV